MTVPLVWFPETEFVLPQEEAVGSTPEVTIQPVREIANGVVVAFEAAAVEEATMNI